MKSGFCKEDEILTKAECFDIGKQEGMEVQLKQYPRSNPRGCYYDYNRVARTNFVYFNGRSSTEECSSKRPCICKMKGMDSVIVIDLLIKGGKSSLTNIARIHNTLSDVRPCPTKPPWEMYGMHRNLDLYTCNKGMSTHY